MKIIDISFLFHSNSDGRHKIFYKLVNSFFEKHKSTVVKSSLISWNIYKQYTHKTRDFYSTFHLVKN